MCGIFGYVGPREGTEIVLEGIRKLEYRGYDSAGVAGVFEGGLFIHKEVGRIEALEDPPEGVHAAIAHTRWATHGKPTAENAHPHSDAEGSVAVVHNGIIENFEAVRALLAKRGVVCLTETDTEVIALLVGYLYRGSLLRAVQRALPLLKGAFAVAVVHAACPEEMVCAARESPLAIGMGDGEMFVASDASAFLPYTKRAIYLHASEVAHITPHSIETFNGRAVPITKASEEVTFKEEEASKGAFSHYMLKEIYEQPQTVRNATILEGLDEGELQEIERIVFVACGTSYHAALVGAYMLEELARIPVQVEISSEFRYKNPLVAPHTLAIALSQSGETADTLAAVRELKEKGARVLGICNAQGSTLARSVDRTLFLRAGPEISVASTKAFTSQLTLLALFTLRLARMRTMSGIAGDAFAKALYALPDQLTILLKRADQIERLAAKYAHFDNFFYLGRRYMYPTALEGALKLKEIAYVNANGYPAGEMKHGPIALINPDCLTVAFCSDTVTYPKIISNLMEVRARSGPILAIAPQGAPDIASLADDVFWLPPTLDPLAPILSTLFSQLFAYHIARLRGTEIDQPRNLAKSVTVE